MKYASLTFSKIQSLTVPKGIRATAVEESPATGVLLGHYVGIRGGSLRSDPNLFSINLVLLEIV